MKKLAVLSLFALLALPAFAATPEADAADSAVEAVDLLLTPASSPDCEAGILADLFAVPIMKLGYTNTCGACSVPGCRNVGRGTWCAPGKWCIPTATQFCPGTQDWDCQCASEYY